MSQNQIRAFIRGLMPFVYAWAAAFIAHLGYHAGPRTTALVLAVTFAVLSALLHWLEIHFPWVGIFLGWIGIPAFPPSKRTTLLAEIARLQTQVLALTPKPAESPQNAPEAPPVPVMLEATGTGTFSAEGAQGA